VTCVARKGIGDILVRLGLVDELVEVEKGNRSSYKKIQNDLSSRHFKLLICPHQSFRTALLVSKISAEKKIGFRSWWNKLFFHDRILKNLSFPDAIRQLQLTSHLDPSLPRHLVEYQQDVNAVPDWASMDMSDRLSNFRLERSHLIEKLGLQSHRSKSWFCLFPGSVWATKKWTPSGFIEVGQDLLQKGFVVLLMGSKNESGECEQIKNEILKNSSISNEVINLAGKTSLFESALLLTIAKGVLTNDSGSMHLASVAGVPTVAIFGPTTLSAGFRPWQKKARVVENKDLKCRPCGPHGHQKCPLGTHECMKSISSQTVIQEIHQLT
jgi:heptosyltransferase-2